MRTKRDTAKTEGPASAPGHGGSHPPSWVGLVANTGALDRVIRLLLSVALLFVVWFSSLLGSDLLVKALITAFVGVNLLAVATGWCPVYQATGKSTASPRSAGYGPSDSN